MSGKLFAVVVIVIALASAVPIINHTFMGANVSMPEDISTHGYEIDKQIDETMIGEGDNAFGEIVRIQGKDMLSVVHPRDLHLSLLRTPLPYY